MKAEIPNEDVGKLCDNVLIEKYIFVVVESMKYLNVSIRSLFVGIDHTATFSVKKEDMAESFSSVSFVWLECARSLPRVLEGRSGGQPGPSCWALRCGAGLGALGTCC